MAKPRNWIARLRTKTLKEADEFDVWLLEGKGLSQYLALQPWAMDNVANLSEFWTYLDESAMAAYWESQFSAA